MDAVARAEDLARELVEPLGQRWRHVQGVAARAKTIANVLLPPEERSAVVVSAWLHDIGYAKPLATTGFHPLDGARYLRDLATFDQLVTSLVAYHTGASIEAEERGLGSELAHEFRPPPTHLLDVLTTADLAVGPDGLPIVPSQRVSEILARYPAEDPVHRAVTRSGPDLVATADAVLRSADERL